MGSVDVATASNDLGTNVLSVKTYVNNQVNGLNTAIDTRIDGIDTQIDGIDTRIDGVDTRINGVVDDITDVQTNLNTLATNSAATYMKKTADTNLNMNNFRITGLQNAVANTEPVTK